MDELLDQFIVEGRELVQQAAEDLLALEQRPDDGSRINSAFRAIHTLKGSTGIFDMAAMGRALHAAEDLLGLVRSGAREICRSDVDRLLDCVGRCDEWIEHIAAKGRLSPQVEAESARLVAVLMPSVEGKPSPAGTRFQDWLSALIDREREVLERAHIAADTVTAFRYLPSSDCFFLGDDPLATVRAVPHLLALHLTSRDDADWQNPFTCNLVIEGASSADHEEVKAMFRFVADQVELAPVPAAISASAHVEAAVTGAIRPVGSTILRVAATQLDDLVRSVGELMVAKNALSHLLGRIAPDDPTLNRALNSSRAAFDRLVSDIHDRSIRLRLVPLTQTFQRLPRLVRETAAALCKDVAFSIEGETVEVDKAVADSLSEQLLHLLRNAIDHGIEVRAVRERHGKPAQGHIVLRAERRGEMAAISVSDDGNGISAETIRTAAVARGLLTSEAAAALDDGAALDLVFAAGFSTAEAITSISGRGVGLDVVRASIVSLGGDVRLESRIGQGSTFHLLIPQTATVTTVIVVRSGSERFGIPVEIVTELIRLTPKEMLPVRHGHAFVYRDRTVPVVNLAALIGQNGSGCDAGNVNFLIVRLGDQEVGLQVAAIDDRIDVLLRPACGLLAASRGLIGTALLGDGRVLMVLDVAELVR